MTTRADVMIEAMRRMGARTGTIASGATVSSAVLNGLIGTTLDDSFFQADRLVFFDEAAEADKERAIITWTDQLGQAQFAALSVAPATDDRYLLVSREDYTLAEMRQALDDAQSYARRSYRQVIPLTPNEKLYNLTAMDWLQGAGDIDSVWINQSPILLHNEDFSLWQNGATAAPDGYMLEGGQYVTINRISGGLRSTYRCQIDTTGNSGNAGTARLVQGIPQSLTQWITRRIAPVYTPLRAAGWVQSTTPGNRVFIRYTETTSGSPVTTYVYSDEVSYDSNPTFVELSLTPTATMSNFVWGLEVENNSTAAISAAVFMQNTTTAGNAYAIRDFGSQAYLDSEIYNAVRNVGGAAQVELTSQLWTPMQLVIYCRRPYPALTADDDLVPDDAARVLQYGMLNFLLRSVKPNQDRTRLDYILYGNGKPGDDGAAGIWTRYLQNLVSRPVPRPPLQNVVGSA